MKLLPALAVALAAVVVGNVRAQYNYGGTSSKTAYTGSGGSSSGNYQQTASKSTQYTQGSYNQPSSSKYTQGSYNQPSPSPSPTSQYTQQTNKYTPTGSYSNQQGYSYNNYQGYPSGGYQYPATTTKKSTGYGYTTPKTPTYGYTTPKTPTYGYTTPKTPTYGYSTPKTPTYGYTTPKNPSPTPYYTATPAPTPAPVYPPTTYPTSYNYWDPTKPTPYTWTECEINTIKKILYSWMDQDVIHLNRPATCLRLTFHDCVGVCDGCLNPLDPNNEGLTTIIEDLGTLWYYLFPSFFGKYMSNADFWWLAGIVAVQYTTDVNNYFCSGHTCVMPNLYIRFAYGRTDCRTTPYNNVTEGIPHAGMEYNETMTFYWNNFGFYPEEVVALMGVHTCGSMHSFNSGFDGKWKEDIEQLPFHLFFDDVYYLLLTAKRVNGVLLFWKNEVSSGISADTGNNLTVWQFEGYWDCNYNGIDDDSENEACHATTMLPLDISMVYDIQLDQFMRSNCVPPYCPITPMYWLAVEFALNSTFWSQEFICVYEKMSLNRVNLNYMQLPGDCTASCIAPVVTQYPFTNNLPVVVCDR